MQKWRCGDTQCAQTRSTVLKKQYSSKLVARGVYLQPYHNWYCTVHTSTCHYLTRRSTISSGTHEAHNNSSTSPIGHLQQSLIILCSPWQQLPELNSTSNRWMQLRGRFMWIRNMKILCTTRKWIFTVPNWPRALPVSVVFRGFGPGTVFAKFCLIMIASFSKVAKFLSFERTLTKL